MGRPWLSRWFLISALGGSFWTVTGLLFFPPPVEAQEPPDILVLEPEYRNAQAAYEEAFTALEAMEGRFNQALEDLDSARAANNEAGSERAYALMRRLSGELGLQRRRVEEKAEELREARAQLIEATRSWEDDLFEQLGSIQDPIERAGLTAILEDVNNRRRELSSEEEPETVLRPMGDITINPTDSPRDILRKAQALDLRADRHEARLEDVDARLEVFRQDLQRNRRVSDFLSGLDRFGDTRLPVGSPGTQTNPPPDPEQLPPGADTLSVEVRPLTLDERIRSLETLRTELEERIEVIRDKAARFRARAGGGGAK